MSTILPYLKEKGVIDTVITSPSILSLTLSEIQQREEYIEKIGETMINKNGKRFNSIFGWSRKKFAEKGVLKTEQKRKGREIAEATISSMADIEMLDKVGEELKGLIEKEEREKTNE